MKFFGTLKTVGPFHFFEGECKKYSKILEEVEGCSMFNSLVGYPVLSPQDGPMSWPLAAMNRRKSSRWSPLKAKDLHFKRWEKMQLLRAVDQVAKHFGNDFCNDFRRSSLARLLKC